MMNKLIYFLLGTLFLIVVNPMQAQNEGYANQWFETNQNRLNEVGFEEFAQIPEAQQKDIFVLLPDLAQANIWKQKIDFVLLQNWTQAQKNSLQELYQFTKPESFANTRPQNFDLKVENWLSKAKLLFERDIIIDITTLRIGDIGVSQFIKCYCCVSSWFSCSNCARPSDGCRAGYGCGFMGLYDCNGVCAKK